MMGNELRKPKFKRQRFLLDFICQIGKGVSETNIQKLMFLFMQEQENPQYEFIPYKYGCYSFTLDADIKALKQEGFLIDTANVQMLVYHPPRNNYEIVKERGNKLLAKVYNEYPYYAIHSTVKNEILTPQEIIKVENYKAKLHKDNQVLFTIGYEGRSIEHFMNILIINNIQVLCDVRNTPFSHKFGFSKNSLSHIAKEVDINYAHIPELGIESAKRQSLNEKADYIKLFNEYASRVALQKEHLQKIQDLIDTHKRIALMCFEREPQQCHRHILRDIFKIKGVVCEDL